MHIYESDEVAEVPYTGGKINNVNYYSETIKR